jgi:two-component system, response regulator PdtaR
MMSHAADAERPLVLVAEDEPLASLALRAQLEALDYRVLGPARDGDEALALGLCFPVDVGLFDYGMPRRSGLDAARALFAAAPTPIVLLSGFGAADLPANLPRPPVFVSLTKPADMADLRRGLEAARAGFDQWIAAEPSRPQRVRESREERLTIADAVSRLAREMPLSAAAARFVDEAAGRNQSLIDAARGTLQRQG